MPQDINRNYNLEDEAMLVKARVVHDNLVTDLATFTAVFPTITSETAAALQADIRTAELLPLDNQVMDNLAVLTESVNAQVLLDRQALEELNNYACFTYPDTPKKQQVFGKDNWTTAYSDQEKMMDALEQAHSMASSAPYATEMGASGYTSAKVTNLLNTAEEIRTRNLLPCTFRSTAIGELINIRVSHPKHETQTFENISIVPVASNDVEMDVV